MSVAAAHKGEKKQNWGTPQVLANEWTVEYGLNLDVCAEPWNAKLPLYITEEMDGLKTSWSKMISTREKHPIYQMGSPKVTYSLGRPVTQVVAWCNPPYSQTKHWLHKARAEAFDGVKTVMLVPASTGTSWFYEAMQHCGIWLFLQRIKFDRPPEEEKKHGPNFSPCLIEIGFANGNTHHSKGFLGYRSATTGKVIWTP
jgi:phage N-6-adenine-methyltransferase